MFEFSSPNNFPNYLYYSQFHSFNAAGDFIFTNYEISCRMVQIFYPNFLLVFVRVASAN